MVVILTLLPRVKKKKMASFKLQPPNLLKCPSYERFKKELRFWESATELAKNKRGIVIAMSLPSEDEDPERGI